MAAESRLTAAIPAAAPAGRPKRAAVQTTERRRLAILTNLVPPYRVPIYRRLGDAFEATLLLSAMESNRAGWKEQDRRLSNLSIRRSAAPAIAFQLGRGRVYDNRYLHLPFDHIVDLIRLRPDAVITDELGLRTLIALAYGYLFRKPVWIWWGGTVHTERQIGLAKRMVRRAFSRIGRRWISYGDSSTEYLTTLNVPRQQILQVQNCVDETLFVQPVAPALQVEPRPVLLFVGRMVGLKGIDSFLQATALLQSQGRRFSVLLVGDGPEKERYEELAKSLELQNVTFLPARPPAELPAIYRSADYLVFPTFDDVWGLVVNEALWSGVPVLSSAYAGCAAELLPQEQIFDPRDPRDIARVIATALDGRLPAVDTSRMKTAAEVAELIIADVRTALQGR